MEYSSGVFSGEEWGENDGIRSSNASTSDSAYGTLDESEENRSCCTPHRRNRSLTRKRGHRIRSSSVGDTPTWMRAPIYRLASDADSIADSTSDDSFAATPESGLSTHEPSESDLEFNSSSLNLSPLARRQTVPRRSRTRTASISFTFVAPSFDPPLSPPEVTPTTSDSASLARHALLCTAVASSLTLVIPTPLFTVSPIYLLNARSPLSLDILNALLSPLLVTRSLPALALALANLKSLHSLEDAWRLPCGESMALAAGSWSIILTIRVSFAYLFGRAMGWAHPQLFYNAAVHEATSGFAPLLLALQVVYSLRSTTRQSIPNLFSLASLAANFVTTVEQGGTGFWWGLSAVLAGLLVSSVLSLVEVLGRTGIDTTRCNSRISSKSTAFAILILPLLALFSTHAAPSSVSIERSFVKLHPRHSNLVTILLMTAPRPGNPDFLSQTIESWLGALPDPFVSHHPLTSLAASNSTLSVQDRVKLVVYTHFQSHDLFDSAQAHFSTSPRFAAKAQHYVDWHRDPRGTSNRLDQRLHVARGLEYISRRDNAYVLLAEDDFPLCPDANSGGGGTRRWKETWSEFMRVLVATNKAMPDSVPSTSRLESESEIAGHCGLFIATGGSGLAIRGFIARQLPALLLGASDPQGADREARAERGEFSIKGEDEGADTPDLVIQDCLRGRIPGCEACAPPSLSLSLFSRTISRFVKGSARNPSVARGDRWGKSGLAGTQVLMQHHLGYNSSTLPGRRYGKEEWACGWRQPFNGEPDVLTL